MLRGGSQSAECWSDGRREKLEVVNGRLGLGSVWLGKIVRAFAAVFTMPLPLCRLEAG
jgi:hypothetical protein